MDRVRSLSRAASEANFWLSSSSSSDSLGDWTYKNTSSDQWFSFFIFDFWRLKTAEIDFRRSLLGWADQQMP
jgi:hypothetical protein